MGTPGPNCTNPNEVRSQIQRIVNQCNDGAANGRIEQFFLPSAQSFKDTFATLRAQADDLLRMGDSQAALANLTGNSIRGVNQEYKQLEKRKQTLIADVEAHQRQSDAANKSFLEDIMHNTPTGEPFPTLQDVALYIFAVGWGLLILILVAVRTFSPTGTWRAGLVVFILMTVVTGVVYSMIYMFG